MTGSNLKAAKDFVRRVAERQGWRLNPEAEHLSGVLKGLSTNLSRFGYYLCPCRDGSGNGKLDSDITCPCDYARADLDEYGHCYCGLFFTPALADSGGKAEPIPERRPLPLSTDAVEVTEAGSAEAASAELTSEALHAAHEDTEIASTHTGTQQDSARLYTQARLPATATGGDLCSIRDLIREINELEHELRTVHRLTLNEALCLCCISKRIQSPGKCAEQMGLSPSRLSRILNSLEKKKLIERHLMSDNHRSTRLNLTEAGTNQLNRLRMCGFSFSKLDGRTTTRSSG